MKNKGFTLVEVLGVIIILGAIAAIATITVNNTLKENKQNLYDIQISYIITGAKSWASSHVFELPENDGEVITLTLGQLKQEGLVENDITNPITKQPFDNSMQITITKVDNNYEYKIIN